MPQSFLTRDQQTVRLYVTHLNLNWVCYSATALRIALRMCIKGMSLVERLSRDGMLGFKKQCLSAIINEIDKIAETRTLSAL